MPADPFNDRLAAALGQASGKAAAGAPPAAASLPATPSAGPGSDDFSARLNSAMGQARGGAPPEPSAAASESAPAAPTEPIPESTGPVGTGEHVVREGECVSSIAFKAGHFWETVWDDPGNTELKEARKSPYTLLPEDRVHVPELRRKDEPGATEQRHRFRRKGAPEVYKVRLLANDKPRANVSYVLVVENSVFSGATDADGFLEEYIPPDAKRGKLIVDNREEYPLRFGALDPISELSGVLDRLVNLNFLLEKDKEDEEAVEDALQAFQIHYDLPVTRAADQATRAKILEIHGC